VLNGPFYSFFTSSFLPLGGLFRSVWVITFLSSHTPPFLSNTNPSFLRKKLAIAFRLLRSLPRITSPIFIFPLLFSTFYDREGKKIKIESTVNRTSQVGDAAALVWV